MDCPFKTDTAWTVTHHAVMGGNQFRFTFPNGWGASVVRHPYSYGNESGLWELAVIGKDGHLNYKHKVAEFDVRGSLTEDDVSRLVAEIAATTDSTPMNDEDSRSDGEKIANGIEALGSFLDMAKDGQL